MKKMFFFFFIFPILIFTFSTTAYSQGKVGSVNLALLYSFHPLVQTFVPEEGYFLKIDKNINFQKRAEKNKKKIREISSKIYKIYKKIKSQKSKKEEAQMAAYRNKRRIETDIESIKKNPANKKKKFNFSKQLKKIEDIKKEYEATIKKIDVETIKFYKETVKLNDELKSINYYTGKDHQKMVSKIVNEIKNAIVTVSSKHGIDITMNSSGFNAFRRLNSAKNKNVEGVYNPEHEMVPANIYKVPKEYSIKTLLSTHGGKNKKYAKDALEYNISVYQDMMNNSKNYLKPFSSEPIDSFVVVGGVDLTSEVLAHILRKYDVEKSVINLIIMGIKTKKIF